MKKSIRHFELLKSMAKEHGFEHYEISNLGETGPLLYPNTNYWKEGNPYFRRWTFCFILLMANSRTMERSEINSQYINK